MRIEYRFFKPAAVVVAWAFLAACVHAQPVAESPAPRPVQLETVSTNIAVLVMAEDEDTTTVKRSSDIFKRVLAELRGSMQRHGFRMVDEESVAVDLGWRVLDRRSKSDLLETIKLLGESYNATHQVRAMVLLRIHAQGKSLSFGTRVQTRIVGEIYDADSNQFLDSFEMPREQYPAPADCLDSSVCINEVVGDRAAEIAASLGEVLARKLERYVPPAQRRTRTIVIEAPSTGFGLLTPYTVVLRHFDNREGITIMGVMADEFPGYSSHELINKSAAIRRYQYLTTAKAFKLEEWLYQLLEEMGFNVDKEIHIQVRGTQVAVDKLVPTPSRPESADEQRRFS